MQLRKKTLIIISLTLVGMILLIYAASQVILMQSYTDIENREVRSALNSSLSEINYELSTLDSVTVDYAYWDNTYSYVQNGSPGEYIQSNFVDATMRNQMLNVVVIVNASDQVVYARGYDLEKEEDAPVPAGIRESLSAGSLLIRSWTTGSLHGFVSLPDGPMLISAYPIRKSDGKGASVGMMIMGRFMDDREVGVLRNMSGLAITVLPYDKAGTTASFDPAGQLAADGSSALIVPRDADIVSGYTLIRDIYGNPAFILRVDEPRTVYQQGQNALFYIVTSLLISGIVFSIVMIFFLEKMVMSRMIRLNESVSRIGLDTDISARVPADGDDEVAHLAGTINRTLEALGTSRQQLQDKEQRLRSLVENVNEVVWETDGDLKLVYVSPKVRDVMGYEPDDLLGRSPYDLVIAGEKDQIREVIIDMIARKGSFALVDFSIARPDGSRVDIEIGGSPLRDPAGKIVGYGGIVRDVGERKRAEDAIRQSRRQLEDIINHLPDATFAIDREGKIIAWNKAIEEMTGVMAADMLGRGDHEYAILFYGDRRPILIDLIFGTEEEIERGNYVNVRREGRALMAETRLPRPLGKNAILWGKASALHDENGEIVGAIESIRDVTELRHAESVLRESEARLNTIVDSSPLPLFAIGRDHRIIFWSRSLEEFSGIRAGDVVGTSQQWRPFYGEQRPSIADLLVDGSLDELDRWYPGKYCRSSLFEGAFEVTDYFALPGKWLHIIAIAIKGPGGDVMGAIEIFVDITENKRAEEQMMNSLQEKEVLLKEIHHRVKNNLQIISSLLSLQSENINGENPARKFRESQDRIRSMALIHEKLYQSKDISRIDYAEYVRSLTTHLYRSYVTVPGIEITIDIQDVSLDIDLAIPCGLIINELVSNSLKYAFRDERNGEIRIRLVRVDNLYELTVADDGEGLSPGLDFRDTPSLGLQLVNTLVSQMEGTIELLPGTGTAFKIAFVSK